MNKHCTKKNISLCWSVALQLWLCPCNEFTLVYNGEKKEKKNLMSSVTEEVTPAVNCCVTFNNWNTSNQVKFKWNNETSTLALQPTRCTLNTNLLWMPKSPFLNNGVIKYHPFLALSVILLSLLRKKNDQIIKKEAERSPDLTLCLPAEKAKTAALRTLCSFGQEIQTQIINVKNINELITRIQKYLFFSKSE